MKDDINCTKNSSKRFYMSEIFKSWMLCVKHKINNMTRHSDDLKHFVLKPSTDFLHLFWQPTISIRKCEVSSLIDRDDQITVTLYRWKSEFVGTAVARTNATRGPREGRSRSKGETTWLAANQQGLIDARETGSRRRQRKKRREEKREKGSNGTENGTKDVEDEERRSEVNDAERQMEGWRSRQGEDGERADCKSNEERRVRGSWRKRRTPWSSERREEERRGEEKRGEERRGEKRRSEEKRVTRCKLVGSVSVSVHADGESAGGVGVGVASHRQPTCNCNCERQLVEREFRTDPSADRTCRLEFRPFEPTVRDVPDDARQVRCFAIAEWLVHRARYFCVRLLLRSIIHRKLVYVLIETEVERSLSLKEENVEIGEGEEQVLPSRLRLSSSAAVSANFYPPHGVLLKRVCISSHLLPLIRAL